MGSDEMTAYTVGELLALSQAEASSNVILTVTTHNLTRFYYSAI
jgi:hypothetical protein